MRKTSIPNNHSWQIHGKSTTRSFCQKLQDIQCGIACGVCEELKPDSDLKTLPSNSLPSIKDVKFCSKCRQLFEDNKPIKMPKPMLSAFQ